jgi:hypothetical protein
MKNGLDGGTDNKGDSAGQVIGDTTRKARGMGDAQDSMPDVNRNTEDNMAASMPDTPMSALERGYAGEGSITGDTQSHAAEMRPGMNNKDSEVEPAGESEPGEGE